MPKLVPPFHKALQNGARRRPTLCRALRGLDAALCSMLGIGSARQYCVKISTPNLNCDRSIDPRKRMETFGFYEKLSPDAFCEAIPALFRRSSKPMFHRVEGSLRGVVVMEKCVYSTSEFSEIVDLLTTGLAVGNICRSDLFSRVYWWLSSTYHPDDLEVATVRGEETASPSIEVNAIRRRQGRSRSKPSPD